ncbi:MAG: hypothetical protein H7Z38_08585 [Rubrivivax sp.]|nr:hypothetical protein [Pyrinomonadaceae bacterium]
MKKSLLTIFTLLLFSLSISAQAVTLKGRVTVVVDGDTIAILDTSGIQERVRLQGIDAPEQDQPFGAQAKNHGSRVAKQV